jgi:predicted Zn-dependent protease with MMP-like domain
MGVEMTDAHFEELVADALDQIPPRLADAMDNVVVLVEDRNEAEPEILGLYQGIALTERSHDYGGTLPDTISIYREPILRMCEDEDHVVEEVLITVVHEVAHHFGIDDERLHELGWG